MSEKKSVPGYTEIRRNVDGEVRREREPLDFYGPYIWSEGNFACDCNRALFFANAGGELGPDVSCGTGRYSARVLAEDGSILYQDDDWETAALTSRKPADQE